MKTTNNIETLDQAIEAGLKIKETEWVLKATYQNGDNIIARFDTFEIAYSAYLELCSRKGIENIQQPTDQKTAMNLKSRGNGYTVHIFEEAS